MTGYSAATGAFLSRDKPLLSCFPAGDVSLGIGDGLDVIQRIVAAGGRQRRGADSGDYYCHFCIGLSPTEGIKITSGKHT